ncbi:type 1 periplasmic binding fold superfamily protein [Flavobacterium album]|uniref:Type 1 periplasmic binding fold superfamily protein n=1 Tax=Flavobacterium album TaxID=2175091 RepID=A0A2S1QUX9_9FLAO|nr:type 1 periplasmic binding fold superfamily protein [Flavobacterium album]AWH84195.1 type 1 periplasmic binding fold superfamily protein [Flavobacterium album]
MKNFRILALALITITTFSSCSSDNDSGPVNEEEVITTVAATFTPVGGGTPVVLMSRDLDGDGPDAPVVSVSGNFTAGRAYEGAVNFLNELANPVEEITGEIQEEGTQHQIFFQHSGIGTFTYTDEDANGHPIGLSFLYTATTTPGAGSLTITLRHQPNKSGENVPEGNIANAGGSTDAQVNFSVVVE